MFRENCQVLSNEKTAPGHFVIRFKSEKIARAALPGQFVQVACSESYEPFLPRPFSFLDASKSEFSFLYHVVGKGTTLLSKAKKGDLMMILGPLGNGFDSGESRFNVQTPLLVGGGVGIPPLYHLAKHRLATSKSPAKNIHVFLGARDKSLLLLESEFKKLGVTLHLTTDNGSRGQKGLVTGPLEEFLADARDSKRPAIYTCGPTPMLKAVSALGVKYQVPCEVSVEVPMACGFGACLGCAITVQASNEGGKRFAIACCEGPVFQGKEIVW